MGGDACIKKGGIRGERLKVLEGADAPGEKVSKRSSVNREPSRCGKKKTPPPGGK